MVAPMVQYWWSFFICNDMLLHRFHCWPQTKFRLKWQCVFGYGAAMSSASGYQFPQYQCARINVNTQKSVAGKIDCTFKNFRCHITMSSNLAMCIPARYIYGKKMTNNREAQR